MSMHRDLLRIRRKVSNVASPPSPPPTRASPRGGTGSARGEPRQGVNEAVRVAARVRPLASGESGQEVIVSMDPSAKKIFVKNRGEELQEFPFELPVWSCNGKALNGSPPVTQAALYKMVGQPLLDHAFEGFNSTLMVYGSTGSGKTYTMMGDMDAGFVDEDEDVLNDGEEGIVPRLCREMFQKIRERSVNLSNGGTLTWDVHASYVEVYCEKISDLLNSGAPVTVREVVTENETHFVLSGAERVNVRDSAEILRLLKIGNRHRKTASTAMNERSSRSHAIFIVELTEMLVVTGPDGESVGAPGKYLAVRLVDLAGSERVGEVGMSGQLFKEGVDINCSLFTLGLVIEALSDPSRRHMRPPYRDSTLTKILKDAFGGNSKTTMICTIAPTESQRVHTIQTLQYGLKARRIVNKPCAKKGPSAKELRKASEEMLSLRRQCRERHTPNTHLEGRYGGLKRSDDRRLSSGSVLHYPESSSDGKETSLGGSNPAMEEQKELYRKRMEELEEEIERARARYREQGRELHNMRKESAAEVEVRLRALEAQFSEKEDHLKRKEHEIQKKRRDAENRLRELKNVSEERIASLLRVQEELKGRLDEKNRAAGLREREFQEAQERAGEEVSRLRQRMAQQEKKWLERHRALEAEMCAKDDFMSERLREAMEKIRATEETAAQRESDLHRKYLEAQQVTRELHNKLAKSEADKIRQVSQDRLETCKREADLSQKLEESERCRRSLECETLSLRRELDGLRKDHEALIRSDGNVGSGVVLPVAVDEDLRNREEQLEQRERQTLMSLDEVVKKQEEINRLHFEMMTKADSIGKEVTEIFRERESQLNKREGELRNLLQELETHPLILGEEARRKVVECEIGEHDAGTSASYEHQAVLHQKNDLQQVLQHAHFDMSQREDKFDRADDVAKRCGGQLNGPFNEQEVVRRPSVPSPVAGEVVHLSNYAPLQGDTRCGSGAAWPPERGVLRTLGENCVTTAYQRTRQNRSDATIGGSCGLGVVVGERDPSALQSTAVLAAESICLWVRNMLLTVEEGSRRLLEDLCNHEYSVLKRMLDITPSPSFERGTSEANYRALYEESAVCTSPPESGGIPHTRSCRENSSPVTAVFDDNASLWPVAPQCNCPLQGGTVDHGCFTRDVAGFPQDRRQCGDTLQLEGREISAYLRELEAMDRERTARHRLTEERHKAAVLQLREARIAFIHHVTGLQRDLFVRDAEQQAERIALREATERESLFCAFTLHLHKMVVSERSSIDCTGYTNALRNREHLIMKEEADLNRRIGQLKAKEEQWRRRHRAEQEQIRMYLFEVQNQELLKKQTADGTAYSQQYDNVYIGGKERQLRTNGDVARDIQGYIPEHGRVIRNVEEELGERMSATERAFQEREANVEKRRCELSGAIESRERSLLEKEAELEALTRRMDTDIRERELAIQRVEEELGERMSATERAFQEREANVEKRRCELSGAIESRERSLLEKEAELEALTRRMDTDIRERELAIQRVEEELGERMNATERAFQEREANVEKRRCELSGAIESRESSLYIRRVSSSKSSDDKGCGKPFPISMSAVDGDVDKMCCYINLQRVLEVCGIKLEGEKLCAAKFGGSVVELTEDVVDVIESLWRQLQLWAEKYRVLKCEEKLVCERCSWQNNRFATVCRCCGNAQLV